MKRIYFDNSASTPISDEVIEVMSFAQKNLFGNPSSIHADGRKVRVAIEAARKTIAKYLSASIGEIFFTSGGTESSNMLIQRAVKDLGVKRFISSPLEHPCILNPLEIIKQEEGIQIDFVKIDDKGNVDYQHLENLLKSTDAKTLVSLMHANNEIGTLLNLEKVAQLCQTHQALFHSDTVQTMGHLSLDVSKIAFSFLTAAAHKFHGPKGIGFIYINNDNMIQPFIHGGSQERNMRGGTENIAGIIGIAKAFELANEQREERRQHIEDLRTYLKNQLVHHFDDIQFNGNQEGNYLHKILNVSFPHSAKSELLVMSLDIAGISVSGGSACSSGVETQSHVLNLIHHPSDRKAIRFSFSHYNQKEEIDFLIEKLKKIIPAKVGV